MTKTRKIRLALRSKPTIEGAGVHLHRAFGSARDARLFDPFLLLDDFRSDSPRDYENGFPGTRIGASKRSLTSSKGSFGTGIAWATAERSPLAMCSG